MDQPQHAENQDKPRPLALYEFYNCPFCARVRMVMDQLGVDIERRDILQDPQYRDQLIEGGGRRTVPCLRIEHADGAVEWMYESGRIIEYLQDLYGQ